MLSAAIQSRADYLVTLNRRHFMDDPQVSKKAGMKIATPGDALEWVRGQMIGED